LRKYSRYLILFQLLHENYWTFFTFDPSCDDRTLNHTHTIVKPIIAINA